MAVDTKGNVYVANTGRNNIQKISTTSESGGYLGGDSTYGDSGSSDGWTDGLNSTTNIIKKPYFNRPSSLAIDATGVIYVADQANHKIRVITPENNRVYKVTTLAGIGFAGFANGTGKTAKFYSPCGVAVDYKGNVYVADSGNYLIRKIIATGYAIYPELPMGLNFDSTTGIISGTPTVVSPAIYYGITAYNTSGYSSTKIVIATTTPLGTTVFNKQELKLYPNPVNTLLHIQTPNNSSIDKVSIVDLTGKKVLEQKQNTSQIDVARLAKGMYIIEVFSGEGKFSGKFMKE